MGLGPTRFVRKFRKTGTILPTLSGLDDFFRAFMQKHSIGAGSLAVLGSAGILANRGFTWGYPWFEETRPESLFRLASLSKIFTCAAVARLRQAGRLDLDMPAFPYLGVSLPLPDDVKAPAGIDKVTIGDLVNHRARLQHGIDHLKISQDLGLSRPPTRNEMVRYIYGMRRIVSLGKHNPLTPQQRYSNYGYVVLTSVVEKAADMDFVAYLQKDVLDSMPLSGTVWRGLTPKAGRLPGEVEYKYTGHGPSRFAPQSTQTEPLSYGGEFILENSEGAGGLVSNALSVARLINSYWVEGLGGRAPGGRFGAFFGSWTCATSLPNGIDYVFLFNSLVPDTEMVRFSGEVSKFLST